MEIISKIEKNADIIIAVLIIIIVIAIIFMSYNQKEVWQSRKLTISGTSAGVQTDYQMKLTVYNTSRTDTPGIVDLGGNARNDFGDLRFTKSDGTTPLDYWIESYTPGVSAVVWVKVDSIPASPGTTNIYLYYGNSSATSVSNGDATFLFFDDFTGTTINASKWAVYNVDGSISQNNKLIFGPKSASAYWTNTTVVSKQTFSRPIAIDVGWEITGGNFYPGEFSAIYFGKFQEPDASGSNNIDWLRYDSDDRSYTQRWINGANQGQAKGAVLTAPISKKVNILISTIDVKTYLDDTLDGTLSDNNAIDNSPVWLTKNRANNANTYFTNFRVRQYAYPEPVWES